MHEPKIVHVKNALTDLEKEVPDFPFVNLISNGFMMFESILQSSIHFLHYQTKLISFCVSNLDCFQKIFWSRHCRNHKFIYNFRFIVLNFLCVIFENFDYFVFIVFFHNWKSSLSRQIAFNFWIFYFEKICKLFWMIKLFQNFDQNQLLFFQIICFWSTLASHRN